MNKAIFAALAITVLAQSPAYAISEKYRKQLEQSGCTQMSELQGCDITKSKAENAKAGFVEPATPAADSAKSQTPYAGQWVAKSASGAVPSCCVRPC
ncbi:hypothetical protein UIA24_01050 [Pseudomonas sp. AL 58]|uniref:hypothetical protein n=1 Tax=Pseudomonas sp. AL 58 TaxID=3104275 RepID=UPI002E99F112|nr:hypothetical protein [Pseudomonas sp. AL 58]